METLRFGKIPPTKQKKVDSSNQPREPTGKKSRVLCMMSYLDLAEIEKRLEWHSSQVRYWCCILHDKDKDENGELKIPHYHIMIETYDPYPVQSVRNWFKGIFDQDGKEVNTLGKIAIDRKSATDYLTHKNAPEKHQYAETEIHRYSDYIKIALVKPRADEQPSLRIIEDMLDGLTEYELVQRYGREYIINGSKYKETVACFIDEGSLPDYLTKQQKQQIYYKYRR